MRQFFKAFIGFAESGAKPGLAHQCLENRMKNTIFQEHMAKERMGTHS